MMTEQKTCSERKEVMNSSIMICMVIFAAALLLSGLKRKLLNMAGNTA